MKDLDVKAHQCCLQKQTREKVERAQTLNPLTTDQMLLLLLYSSHSLTIAPLFQLAPTTKNHLMLHVQLKVMRVEMSNPLKLNLIQIVNCTPMITSFLELLHQFQNRKYYMPFATRSISRGGGVNPRTMIIKT